MPDFHNLPETQHRASYLQYQDLSQYHQLKHGTFTRHGGTSHSPYDSLNTSDAVGDSRKNVAENLMIIKQAMGARRILFTQQTHGTEVLIVDTETTETFGASWRADAMITNVSGVGLMIKQADCQAVILFDPAKNVIANVHCGWRGNVQNILERVVRTMAHHFDCRAEDLVAAIGPSLGPCCAEFITHRDIFPPNFEAFRVSENHFDLWRLSSHQLAMEGINPENITVSEICTRCHMDRFFSYRGEGVTGRFGTVVILT
ncbi:MAG: peptidoglycan editing factor PgeF [Deltaproteobacteria bacterium]|nr:peptidoglycan editing factor PgeF [Deltaproteobacteria bacterium]